MADAVVFAFPFFFTPMGLIIFLFVMVPMMSHHGRLGTGRIVLAFRRETARDILDGRYATSEIDKIQYEKKLGTIPRGVHL